jgi:hypothetical protein
MVAGVRFEGRRLALAGGPVCHEASGSAAIPHFVEDSQEISTQKSDRLLWAIWGGNGDGQLCSLCRRVISHEQIKYEMDVGGATYRFHSMCHAAWQFECARAEHIARIAATSGKNQKAE